MQISDRICIGSRELYLPISHCLVTDGSNFDHIEFKKDSIKRIYSHAEAFKQCMRYITDTFGCGTVELVKCGSTAEAARLCAQDKESCAICSEDVLQYYSNLKVAVKGIQDVQDNWTRFIVLERRHETSFSGDKLLMITALSYSLELFEIIKKHNKQLLTCYSFQGKVLVECTTDLKFSTLLRLDENICILGSIETQEAQ
jgi:prephenate dehydratase